MSPSNVSCLSNGGGCNGTNHIKHQVSKMDTLAGVAIKYGVEVILLLFFQFVYFYVVWGFLFLGFCLNLVLI